MNRQESFVITLSREVGSGGHTTGRILAEKLGVSYYDKALIENLQKRFNLTADSIEELKGKKRSWLSDMMTMIAPVPPTSVFGVDTSYSQVHRYEITTDDIYEAEVEILKGLAQLNSCVIAGRSGFFVLKDCPNKLDIFITASMPCRIERIMKKQGLTEEEASALIEKVDKSRENYIQRYAGVSRHDARNYDLVISADGHSEEQLADLIISYIG